MITSSHFDSKHMEVVTGIDIGGTKTKVGLVNREGHCLENTWFRTREYPHLDDYLDKVVSVTEELKSKFPEELRFPTFRLSS